MRLKRKKSKFCAGQFFWDELLPTCSLKRFSFKILARSYKAAWFGSWFIPSFTPLVTQLWKSYLLSSGLLSLLSEVIRPELSHCSCLLHCPHRPDGGPPPAESLKGHSLWSSVVYKCSRGFSQCLEKKATWETQSHTERDWNSYSLMSLMCWGGGSCITPCLCKNLKRTGS